MSTRECGVHAAFRFTWPGRPESYACIDHALQVIGVASAIGLPLQLIHIAYRAGDAMPTEFPTCKQQITAEDEPVREADVMPLPAIEDDEPSGNQFMTPAGEVEPAIFVGGGGTFDGGGASESYSAPDPSPSVDSSPSYTDTGSSCAPSDS